MRIRIGFSRDDRMKYLSHLDLMRIFGRAIRRGGIPVAYTEGYNPHAKMVFGLPLQVGVTGEAEYMDIETDKNVDTGDIMFMFNASLPQGIAVKTAREAKAKENIMAIITHAAYEMTVAYGAEDIRRHNCAGCLPDDELKKAVAGFLLPGPRIVVKGRGGKPGGGKPNGGKPGAKKSKPERVMDLAPLVRSLNAHGDTLVMTVSAGSVDNVSPDLVLKALNDAYGGDEPFFKRASLHRKALYVERGGELYKPDDAVICGN